MEGYYVDFIELILEYMTKVYNCLEISPYPTQIYSPTSLKTSTSLLRLKNVLGLESQDHPKKPQIQTTPHW